MVRKLVLLLIITSLVVLPLYSQDTVAASTEEGGEEDVAIPRRLSLIFNFSGNLSESEKLLLRESLLMKLAENDDLLIMEPVLYDLSDDNDITMQVSAAESDCWLKLDLIGGSDAVTISATSYDIYESKYVFQDLSSSKDREIRGITRTFWRKLLDSIDDAYDSVLERKQIIVEVKVVRKEEVTIEVRGVVVTLEAAPGTMITGLLDEPVVVDESGNLMLELLGYSTYNLNATCKGYYPLKLEVYLADKDKTIRLNQKPASFGGVDLYLQNIDYLGLGLYFYILRNRLFAELSATFYQKKLIWPVEHNSERYDLPLTHIFLSAGYYLNAEDSFIRLYLSSGIFIRLIGLEGQGIIIDPLSWGGVKLISVNAELLTDIKFKVFAEYSWLLYLTGDADLMRAAVLDVDNSDHMIAGYIFWGKTVFDLLHFKVGCRLQIP